MGFDSQHDLLAEIQKVARDFSQRRGEHAPGEPYAYVADPDGYEIEIWFE